VGRLSVDQSRREFLVRCSHAASAAIISPSLNFRFAPGFLAPRTALSGEGGFHLQPHYRAKLQVETLFPKTEPGSDRFVTEKYAERMESLLAQWSAALRSSPKDTTVMKAALSSNFAGASPIATASHLIRSHAGLEVKRNQFSDQASLKSEVFLQDLRSALTAFPHILMAEFQVIAINLSGTHPDVCKTRVRYDLVGSGGDFYRQQRVGEWELIWDVASLIADKELRIRSWRTLSETESRSSRPVFVDITEQAFGRNSSYAAQVLHGADYWRTVLDQACGIDIYGHNGVAVGDMDGDGFDDLYVCQGAGLPNRLFRNRGDGTFDDITAGSGLGLLENTACALFADFNNDGSQDLLVVRTDGPVLYRNDGSGNFRKHSDAFHFAKPPQGTFTGAAVADYDRDGYLDIYFCLYLYYQGAEQYKYPSPYFDAENGPPNFLMRNNGDGTFRDVTAESGLNQNNTRYSFCCAWADYNQDGWPDLYVVNDFGRKNLYANQGNGKFTDVAAQAGAEDVGAGMSVCWFDYDRDGQDDLYVANMWTAAGRRVSTQDIFQKVAPEKVRALYRKHSMGNSLFRNPGGDKTFENQTMAAGSEMGRWSWSSDAWDFDHDGFSDLYIANGMISGTSPRDLNSFFWRQVVANSPSEGQPAADYEQGWNALNELIRADGTWSGYERNVFYTNNHDGTFSDVSGVVGMDFPEDSRAFALSDFDHDGRLEVLLKNRNAPQLRLLKNVIRDLAPAIAFRLRGVKSNRDAIGAQVTVHTPAGSQAQTLRAGSGFLSQHTKEMFFGLGEAKEPLRASIRWPSGLVQEFRDLPLNHRVWVEEGKSPTRIEAFAQTAIANESRTSSQHEALPDVVETWLVAPVAAPDFTIADLFGQNRSLSQLKGKTALLSFWEKDSPQCRKDLDVFEQNHAHWSAQGLHLLTVNVDGGSDFSAVLEFVRQQRFSFAILRANDDVIGIYNVLYQYLFDRHRNLSLPTSFLINPEGEIVKIYQGPISREHVESDFQSIPRSSEERLARGLPFPGVIDDASFQRNYLSFGSVFFQREYFDQALASFQFALKNDPSSAEALYGLGSVYLKQNHRADALANFERATKSQASYPETLPNAWNNLGLIATQDAHTEQAIQYFQEALRLSPDHLIALDNLGNAYRQQRRWDEARKIFERALTAHPQDPDANYGLGMVSAQNNDNVRAYEYLQKALQYRPGYPEALNNLGVLYLRTGRREQAVASFEECIRVAPQFDQSYLNLARVHAIEGQTDKAREVLRELLKQHPDHVQAQKALSELGQ
jgi:tetratricopeptide (TPR) repeat protein/peroxiredoxin